MKETIPNFDKQEITVRNEVVTVDLLFERRENQKEFLEESNYDKIIELNKIEDWSSALELKVKFQTKPDKTILVTGIDGGLYLHAADKNEKSCSVKLIDKTIILSVGFTFFSFDLDKMEIKWKVRPDMAEIFEFYDLQNDFLLRGELAIHRIDKEGNIKWSYGGRDIWVSIDGKPEVIIKDDRILLTDFEQNEYVINFLGETIEDKPRLRHQHSQTKQKQWWKFW